MAFTTVKEGSQSMPSCKQIFNIVINNLLPMLKQTKRQVSCPKDRYGASNRFISDLEKGMGNEFHKQVLHPLIQPLLLRKQVNCYPD